MEEQVEAPAPVVPQETKPVEAQQAVNDAEETATEKSEVAIPEVVQSPAHNPEMEDDHARRAPRYDPLLNTWTTALNPEDEKEEERKKQVRFLETPTIAE